VNLTMAVGLHESQIREVVRATMLLSHVARRLWASIAAY
jgi:hypothetical protein